MQDPGFVSTFNRVARDYDRKFGRGCAMAHEIAFEAASRAEVDPNHIFDIGCGTGTLLEKARYRWPSATLAGNDPADKMVDIATDKIATETIDVGKAERISLSDHSVDLVFSTTSFGHWSDQEKGLQEIIRILTPGGFCIIVEHVPPSALVRLLYRLVGRLPNLRNETDMRTLVNRSGLHLREMQRVRGGYLVSTLQAPSGHVKNLNKDEIG